MVDTAHPIHGATGTRIEQEPTILSEAFALLASANAHTTRERRVLKSAVKTVVLREYTDSAVFGDEDSRRMATLRAVRQFLRVATETPAITASTGEYPPHADLLPSCHPLSRRVGTDEARARWMAGDPEIAEGLRPLVASALVFPADTVEGTHARERLRSHTLPAVIAEKIQE